MIEIKQFKERYEEIPWYQKGSTITLYHGTTWELAQKIKKEGLKPLNVKDEVEQMIRDFALNPNDIPNQIKGEVGLRPENRIYLTNKKEEAIQYAKSFSTFGGEALTQTARRIMNYLGVDEEEIYERLRPTHLILALVTVDMPWSEAKTYRSLSQVLLRFKKYYGDDWLKQAKKAGFEFYSEESIPSKYIVRIDKI